MTQVLDPMLDTQSRFSTSVISKFEDNMDLQHVSINNNKIELCSGTWGERERGRKKKVTPPPDWGKVERIQCSNTIPDF